MKMSSYKKDSFVVVSDFHSYTWPLEKITNSYLNKYDKIFILGDATDRGEDSLGTDGIYVLRKIKELSEKYPGRVVYVPGNHDKLLLDYCMIDIQISMIII